MAKDKTKKIKKIKLKKKEQTEPAADGTLDEGLEDKLLPQNILAVGERVEADKNIYISQKTYKDIHKFTKNKTTNESGGMLVGRTIEEFGKTNIVIDGFVEAKHCEATPTTLKFTHETWEYVHAEIEKKYPNEIIVGWIHTHPDFGIFLSEYDKFIHENFFKEDYEIAYVVDPIQKIEGFYFWINGNLERCRGFYIYDKTGVKIDIDNDKDRAEEDEEKEKSSAGMFKNIAMGVMALAIIFLIFANISQSREMNEMKVKFNQILGILNNTDVILNDFDSRLKALEPTPTPAPETAAPAEEEQAENGADTAQTEAAEPTAAPEQTPAAEEGAAENIAE